VAESISNRLGWLDAPERAVEDLPDYVEFAEQVRGEGIRHVLLLGMGGSSLCPLVAADMFKTTPGWPELIVLDNVDPESIRAAADRIDPLSTLFVVASKSGSTIETISLYRYFYERVASAGDPRPGARFVALTDPGSELSLEAQERGFRRTFETPSDVGGRFSALTAFGLVPMALAGYDVGAIVESAREMQAECAPEIPDSTNPGVTLGLALAHLRNEGRDKLTLLTSPGLESFPLWIEQLVAESTGKHGTGIIPVSHEPLADVAAFGPDRQFVHLGLEEERSLAGAALLETLADEEHPVLTITLQRPESIGGEFLRWEIATAVAGAILGVNPFDEPDVTASKTITREIMTGLKPGEIPAGGEPSTLLDSLEFYLDSERDWARSLDSNAADPRELLRGFVQLSRPEDYFGVLAYFAETPDRDALLEELRAAVRARTGVATTAAYGPRYLHSSGQLHKGGPNSGVYLLLTADVAEDLRIPGESGSFGSLQRAQALGDEQALLDRNRRVLRVNLGWYVEDGLAALVENLI
jgi:glucose-6-phosphate isomerase